MCPLPQQYMLPHILSYAACIGEGPSICDQWNIFPIYTLCSFFSCFEAYYLRPQTPLLDSAGPLNTNLGHHAGILTVTSDCSHSPRLANFTSLTFFSRVISFTRFANFAHVGAYTLHWSSLFQCFFFAFGHAATKLPPLEGKKWNLQNTHGTIRGPGLVRVGISRSAQCKLAQNIGLLSSSI